MSKLGRIIFKSVIHSLAVPLLIFYSLTLTGCTTSSSPGISNIFLLELRSRNQTLGDASSFLVRFGYFGICAGFGDFLECTTSSGESLNDLTTTFFSGEHPLFTGNATLTQNDDATKSLFNFALVLQNQIFLWLLAVSGVLFMIGLIISLIEVIRYTKRKYRVNKKQGGSSGRLKLFLLVTDWSSAAFALAATVGIVQASASLANMSATFPSSIIVEQGTLALVLHWLIVAFSFTFALGKIFTRLLRSSTAVSYGSEATQNTSKYGGGASGQGGAGGPVII